MLRLGIKRVSDPIDKGLVVYLGRFLPGGTFGMSASNWKDEFGGLTLNAGGPSGSRSLSASRHLNHYREYSGKSLNSQTISVDTGDDSVYDINMTNGYAVELKGRLTMSKQKTTASHLNGMHDSAKHGCWYCAQRTGNPFTPDCPHVEPAKVEVRK
jgi:hypothetical protein